MGLETLDAEAIDAEHDEYWRELYKVQKIFLNKMKKLTAEWEERDRERKKKKRHTEDAPPADDATSAQDEEELPPSPPAALAVCTTVQDQMKDFKVGVISSGVHWRLEQTWARCTIGEVR
jgi:hypothetical protein